MAAITTLSQAKRRAFEIGFVLIVGIVLVGSTLAISVDRLTEPFVKLLTALMWPYFLLVAIVVFREQTEALILAVAERISGGGAVELGWLKLPKLEKAAEQIPVPGDEKPVTMKNIALLHTSFFSEDGTNKQGDGRVYYQFEVIVMAPAAVMARIDQVTYTLEDAWPIDQRVVTTADKQSRFKMKQLANGTSIVTADVRVRGQKELLQLNRFIDLRRDGPKI